MVKIRELLTGKINEVIEDGIIYRVNYSSKFGIFFEKAGYYNNGKEEYFE